MSDQQAISKDRVHEELERVLSSRGFANAGRLSRLLRHVVDKTLAGEADQLKEYSVGMEVFDRDEKYNPRLDSIVRVEAGRLRSRLDEYYGTEGASDAVRISLPRGAYVARFEDRLAVPVGDATQTADAGAAPRRGWATWAFGLGLIGVAAGMVVWFGGSPASPGPPSVAVLAFAQYSASDEDARWRRN